MRIPAAVLLSAMACSAQAQTVMDGSDRGLPETEREIVVRSVAEESTDPYAVQIRRLRRLPGPPEVSWCGEVNVKGPAGGYLGFRPFFAIPATAGTFSSYSKDGGRNAYFDSIIERHCR